MQNEDENWLKERRKKQITRALRQSAQVEKASLMGEWVVIVFPLFVELSNGKEASAAYGCFRFWKAKKELGNNKIKTRKIKKKIIKIIRTRVQQRLPEEWRRWGLNLEPISSHDTAILLNAADEKYNNICSLLPCGPFFHHNFMFVFFWKFILKN